MTPEPAPIDRETGKFSPAGTYYDEAGSGETVLFLHGSGPGVSGWSNFSGNFDVFAEKFHTLVPDMPGFGRSKWVDLDRIYPEIAAEQMVRFMDEVGVDKAHLVGNSMGGYVAVQMALEFPDRVNRMALMGPGGLAAPLFLPFQSEGSRRLFDFFANPCNETMEGWVDTMVGNRAVVTEELIEARTQRALQPGMIDQAKRIFASMGEHAAKHTAPWKRATEIGHETLIIWGRDDRMLPYEQAHFAFRQLPNAEMTVFSNCGHWAMIEQKEAFERVVIEYFTR
ncbi:MAG: alpha/beta fold hydrolase [Propionibacterium sp.]|nr:alpha/beta fold hydrolase [Propionibacterium sp.]